MRLARVHAGGKGVQPPDAVGKAKVHQKLQRAIGNRGLVAKAFGGKALQHVISAHGPVLFQQDFKHPPPDRGEPRPRSGSQSLGPVQGIGRATGVVMAGKGKVGRGASGAALVGVVWGHGLLRSLTSYNITYIRLAQRTRECSMRYIISFLLTSIALPAAADVPRVVTDLPAVHSIAAQVMAGVGEPVLLLDRGANAHSFQLRPSQASALARADLVIWIGPEMTPWLDRALDGLAQDAARLALLRAPGTQTRNFGAPGEQDHAHDHGHAPLQGMAQEAATEGQDDHAGDADHGHDGVDPHAWLDPANAMVWADLMATELGRLDPANAAAYTANAASAKAGIAALDAEIAASLAPVTDRPFVVFHDGYGYFTNHYGLVPAGAIALGDATSPGAARLSALQASINQTGTVCLFPEVQHDPALVQQVAEASGARVGMALDPSGSSLAPGAGMYAELLRNMAFALSDCLNK